MEILITKYNKIPLKERIKIPFFYRINQYKKNADLARLNSIKTLYGTAIKTGKHYNFKNGHNCYNCRTYLKNGTIDYSIKKSKNKSRSLDAIYFMYLGYYELNPSKETFISFLEEFILFYLSHYKDFYNKIQSKSFLNTIQKYEMITFTYPIILKCPHIGKFVIITNSKIFNIRDVINYKKYFTKYKKELKFIFSNFNENKFSSSVKYLNSDFKFLSVYKNTSNVFFNVKSSTYEIDENLFDIYYKLFENSKSLSELFDIAFDNLKEKGFKY